MALIVDARVRALALPLRSRLATAKGWIAVRRGSLVRLRTDAGLEGWGEATPVPGFPGPSVEETRIALERDARRLLGTMPERSWPPASGAGGPAALFALETAVADLCARREGRSLACFLAGGPASEHVPVNALVDGPTAAARAVSEGFRTVKLKVGVGSIADDLDRVRSVRSAIPPEVSLRLDANQAWSFDDARHVLAALENLRVEHLEEPLREPTPKALAALRANASVPLAADECAARGGDFEALLAAAAVDRVILKPGAIGGLRAARLRAARCADAGVDVVVTTGLEGAIAGLAALHLAASLQGPLPACGLATAGLLARDLCPMPEIHEGMIRVPSTGGLGAAPDPAALSASAARAAREPSESAA